MLCQLSARESLLDQAVERVDGIDVYILEPFVEERRHQVFVSSTFLDLKEERAAVVAALLQMEAFPAGMELFPAADDNAWSLITRVIDSSDYYLLVIGGMYGSVDAATELSYTEKEYDYAVAQKKPVMAFLHGDPGSIPLEKSEKSEEAREKLEAFRTKVETAKHVRYWKGAENLQGQVALSFSDFRQRYPAVGWIRGDVETSTEALGELNALRKKMSDMEEELAAARAGPPSSAEGLAQGEDRADLEFDYKITAYTNEMESWDGTGLQGTLEVALTWDELFSRVGPEMLDEAEEQVLSKRLNEMFNKRFESRVEGQVKNWAKGEGETLRRITGLKGTIRADDFGTFIIQMKALGLIEKSERNRSVKDTGTYWRLTPHGEDHLTTLRAIRRADGGSDQPPEPPGASPPKAPTAKKAKTKAKKAPAKKTKAKTKAKKAQAKKTKAKKAPAKAK